MCNSQKLLRRSIRLFQPSRLVRSPRKAQIGPRVRRLGFFGPYGGLAIYNPNLAPAIVTFDGFADESGGNKPLFHYTYTVPTGELYLIDITQALSLLDISGDTWINVSEPVRFIISGTPTSPACRRSEKAARQE
jgi:hypothetical protein